MTRPINRKLIYATGAVLGAILVWFIFLRGGSHAATGKFEISTASVQSGDVSRIVSASGSVRALTTVEVGSQVSGQITELLADFNTEVEAGQIIARIDPQTFESRVESASADVQSARASLAVQQANIASAEATFAQAEKNYARQKALYEADAVAQSTLEDNERALAVAR
ncbi:MAG TPA: secretion protein HlyD, partial [Hyphomonas sp.]|nr:secretion protein HlyD [Hyphomonas sp.]